MGKFTILLSFILVFSIIAITKLHAQKTDTLFHTNGNVLTGEVKKFSQGLLYFKMDGMGTIKVENEEIKSLISNKFLRILTKHNEVYYGDIDSSSNWGELKIGLLDQRDLIRVTDITEIFPINNTFWLRLDGKVDLSLDYSSATKMFRVNGSGQVNYRKEKWYWKFKYNNLDTWQELDSLEYTSKSDIELSNEYFISPRWRLIGTVGRGSNTALGLQSRWLSAITFKNYIMQTNRTFLDYVMGLSANIERGIDNTTYNTNYEVVLGGNFSVFKYKSPEISIDFYANVIPNLKTKGRWRFDSGLDARVEVFADFYIFGKVYFQYDSMPVDVNAQTKDYNFSTGFGYSFN